MREEKDAIVQATSKRREYMHRVLYSILEIQFDK